MNVASNHSSKNFISRRPRLFSQHSNYKSKSRLNSHASSKVAHQSNYKIVKSQNRKGVIKSEVRAQSLLKNKVSRESDSKVPDSSAKK